MRAAFGETVEACGHLMEVDPRDRMIGARLRRRGVWSRAETDLYGRIVRRGDTVVDVGAHVGYFTLLFARLVGPSGRVVAVEPEPGNLALLRSNIARNGYANVVTIDRALADIAGESRLHLSDANLGDHRLGAGPTGRETLPVRVTTLDACTEGAPVDLIKLDVQGREPAVLAGAARTVAASRRLSLLTEFWTEGLREAGHDPADYLDALARLGFSIAILQRCGSLTPVEGEDQRQALCRPETDVNLLCRKGAAA